MGIASIICITVVVVVGIVCGSLLAKRQQDAQNTLLMADMQRNTMAQLHRNNMELQMLISESLPAKSSGDSETTSSTPFIEIGVGWLIERKFPDGPRWAIFNEGGVHWTTDSSEACRFSRQSDAEQLGFGDDVDSITHHMWG